MMATHLSADDHFASPGMTEKYISPTTIGMNQSRD